jgi:hypothetical protein
VTLEPSPPAGLTPDAGTRLAEQVRDLGFYSARSVIGRFAQLFEQFHTGVGSPMEINPLDWLQPRLGDLSQDEPTPLCLPEASPGGRSCARMWLHNPTSNGTVHLRFWTPGMVTHDGGAIPAPAIAFDPPALDLIGADSSTVIAVSVEVPRDTTGGQYHGLVMVHGLADCAFPVTLTVIHPGPR